MRVSLVGMALFRSVANRGRPVLLWIKLNRHALRVVGGAFFGVAFLVGIVWIAGYEVEPIAFTFGMLSSLFLALPSVANFLIPDRKPVRHMTFEELIDFIPTTDPANDWHGLTREWSSEYFLKEDPRLRFRSKFTDDGIQNDRFTADWANCHPDKKAVGYWCDLYYDGAFIDRRILVSVDGARANLPAPALGTKVIKKADYHLAKIHDQLQTLDEYITRSKLSVEDSEQCAAPVT